jgi:hypothetical protein
MVTFGGVELPLVLEVEERNRKIYVEQAIPGASLAKRLVRGSFGREFMVRGIITANVVSWKNTLRGLADGTARSLDLEDGSAAVTCLMLDPVFRESGKPNQALYECVFVQSS